MKGGTMQIWKAVPFMTSLLVLQAQIPSAPQPPAPAESMPPGATVPLYRVTVVQGSAKAINYRNLKSSTKIGLKGTVLSPEASGVAKVKSEKEGIRIIAKVEKLPPPSTLGGEFLTYVLWGISPEGRATNLGEIALNKHGNGKIKVTEGLQSFGLVVTAEPYFAVSQPSDAVVMENVVDERSAGQVELIEAKYELLKRGQYTLNLASSAPIVMDEKTPFDVYQARNAVNIARATGAQAFAGEAFGKAEGFLKEAETEAMGTKDRIMMAREAIQRAEDARLISVQRQDAQRVAMDHKLALDKLEEVKREAAMAAEAKDSALKMAQKTEQENEGLKDKLKEQLNAVLKTHATARGLIVNMSGVLFQTGKATLAPPAREKLAKIAGILVAHKGLKIEADGFTDSTGTEAFNRELSEKRAMMTKEYLVEQGVSSDSIIFKGFGEANPIASNDTDAGRQENRRVELVVSGEGVTEHVPSAPKTDEHKPMEQMPTER
jgi:outer membrane protein OmpA-like peptidoglycan-associated protein